MVTRVTAVVGGDHQYVALSHTLNKLGQPSVKGGKRRRIAVNILSVTVEHIEVYEVCKAQTVKVGFLYLKQRLHTLFVVVGGQAFFNARTREDVVYLSDRNYVKSAITDSVHSGFRRGCQRVIVAVLGALVRALTADKGAGDNSSHRVLTLQYLAGNAAVFVKLLYGNVVLVCRDLKNAVSRGVDDKVARVTVSLSVVADNVGAGVGQVAEHASACAAAELVKHLSGKAVRVGGHRLFGHNTHHLPVSRGGVLAATKLSEAAYRSPRGVGGGQIVHAVNVAKSQRKQGRDIKFIRSGNTLHCVRSVVAEISRIRRVSDSNRVKNDYENSFCVHYFNLSCAERHISNGAAKQSPYIDSRRLISITDR